MSGEPLEVLVLGPTLVRKGGEAVRVERLLERALLVRLALAGGAPVADGRLATDLWGDVALARPVQRLRVLASRLRAALGTHAAALSRSAAGYALAAEPADLNAARSVAEGLAAVAVADHPAAVRARADKALGLWRGPALADLPTVPFAGIEAARLGAWRLDLLVHRFTADLALGAAAGVVTDLDRLAAEHPLHEGVRGLLARALYQVGRQAEALDQLTRLRRALADELGVDPTPATADLELRLLRHDPDLRVPVAPTIAAAGLRTHLAAPPTSFVGRDGDLTALVTRLAAPRLVTLVGGPGAGKSRLAVEAACAVAATGRRTTAIELAPLHPNTPVVAELATALGVIAADGDLVARCAEALAGALLVLDNAEHVVDQISDLTRALRRRTPDLTVLVTSQRPLLLADEEQHRVGPLGPGAAAALFVQRCPSGTATADAADVAAICRAVDHLPLGIELAAGLTRALTVAQLAERMPDRLRLLVGGRRDAGARHASLRAALDWSHDLLGERESTVLRRAAAFAGGFDLEAAEEVVAGHGLDRSDVAPALAELVDRSLVTVRTGGSRHRFALLETVRDHALDRLAVAGELDAVRAAHLSWCRSYVGSIVPTGADATIAEWPNLLAALEHAPGTARASDGLRLALALQRPWLARGQFDEARRHLAALAGAAGAGLEEQCRALLGHCVASALVGDLDEAAELLARTTELAASSADGPLRLTALGYRGIVAVQRDRLPEAFEALSAGRRLAAELGDDRQLAAFAETTAWAHLLDGNGAAALRSYREAVAIGIGPADGHLLAQMLAGMSAESTREVLGGLFAFVVAVNQRQAQRWRAVARAEGTDEQMRQAHAEYERRMRHGNHATVAVLAARGVLRTDRPQDELGDLLWSLVHPDNYHRLVTQAGWSVAQYAEWLRRSALELLLPAADPAVAEGVDRG